MNRRTAALAPLVVVASLSVLHGTQQTTFRSRTDLVRVDVLASNGRQPITDLTPADFDVRDQGTQQKIEFMRLEDLPLNIVVVCDLSLSVAGDDAANIVRAVRSLLPTLRKGDRVSLITFGDVVVERLPLTEDVGSLVTALEAAKPGGLTPLIDAVYSGITLIGPEPGRSLALVFSDGLDTSSFLRRAQLLEAVKASPATVYAASVGSASTALLKEVTDTSGGRHTEIASTRNLEAVFSEFLGEFRKRYVLGYEPTSTAPGWHRLEIKVRRAGVDVRARPGYVVAR